MINSALVRKDCLRPVVKHLRLVLGFVHLFLRLSSHLLRVRVRQSLLGGRAQEFPFKPVQVAKEQKVNRGGPTTVVSGVQRLAH